MNQLNFVKLPSGKYINLTLVAEVARSDDGTLYVRYTSVSSARSVNRPDDVAALVAYLNNISEAMTDFAQTPGTPLPVQLLSADEAAGRA